MVFGKKSNFAFNSLGGIIIALIAGLAIIGVVVFILGAFTDPNKIEEGIKCRILIQTSATLKEATFGLSPEKLIDDACPTLQKTIPMRDEYPIPDLIGKRVSKMTPDQLNEVIRFDLVELINNAWWITGEGDRSEDIFTKLSMILSSTNQCYVVYAVRIHTNREFTPVSDTALQFALKDFTRAQIKGGSLAGDQRTVLAYLTFDGKTTGVSLNGNTSKIEYQAKGADALYGIAVGFADKSKIAQLAKAVFGDGASAIIKPGASFIYIAPYEKVGSLCRVI